MDESQRQPEDVAADHEVQDQAGVPAGSVRRTDLYMIVAVVLFAVVLGMTLFLIRSRDDGPQLAGAGMTLVLSYPLTSDPVAHIEGQPDAAPAGARLTCRTTTTPPRLLGDGVANTDGSFVVILDSTPWPLESFGGDLYNQLNGSIECRAGNGDWVRPLRPPRVSVA